VVVFSGAMTMGVGGPPVLYLLLNFMCLYLAASCLPATLVEMGVVRRDGEGEAADLLADWRSVRYQTAVFGLTGGLVYVVLPQTAGVTFLGLISAILLGATIRISGALVSMARSSLREARPVMFVLMGSLIVSWLLVVAAGTVSGAYAGALIKAAQTFDILALVAGLLSLQTSYIVMGTHMREVADEQSSEARTARDELSQLNRVASDLYEDTNSQMSRHANHARMMSERASQMERMLEIGIRIQQHKNVKELLQMVAELVRDNLGFETVIIRLLNERTQSFEPRAYVGLNPEAQEAVMNHRITVSDYSMMTEPKYRVGRSYFLKGHQPVTTIPAADDVAPAATAQWTDVERLIVPLVDDDAGERTIGYISVEDPDDPDRSMVDVIDTLETIATLATIAIRNLNRYREVGEKNEKLKHYAEKLSSLNKMKSNFVATISHEFRTPLTSIKAYCETLLKNADSIDRDILKEFLVVIQEEGNRLMTLIEDILDFSQMESGAVRFERTSCNLNEIISITAGDLEKNFEGKRLTLTAQLPQQEVKVRAERDLMKQLVMNLLHNASKFTPEGGKVWVRLEDEVVSARIIVEDDGIGIPDDQIDKIFDHFHQVDASSTRRHGGTGIGLAICKNIVEWHDGRIWVENVPGRGARFVVVIPKKQAVVRSELLTEYVSTRRFEVERYMELVVELVAELLNVRRASLMMVDDDGQELRIESAIGLDEEVVEHARVRLGESVAGNVAQGNSAFLVRDVDVENRISGLFNGKRYHSKSFLSVPVRRDDRVIGVINVTEPVGRDSLDESDHALLELFAQRVVLALDALSHFKQKSREFEDVRTTFKSILDAKRYIDTQTAEALAIVLRDVAVGLGMSADESAALRYAFNVYDLGLAKIGHNIIKQPRELTAEDREHLEQHTIVGTDMLKQIEFIPRVRDAVLYHHENYDGSGYPGKLTGDEIPLEARIIRVADTFRALVSHRPYQKQYNLNEAIEVVRHRAGTMFDPKVVEVFVECVNRHADRFRTISSEAEAPAEAERTAH
jgi:signal transduction histidine kinase/putative methionine-R-sulfoxide reductase with GAF domain